MELDIVMRGKGLKNQLFDIKNIDDYIRCIIALDQLESKCKSAANVNNTIVKTKIILLAAVLIDCLIFSKYIGERNFVAALFLFIILLVLLVMFYRVAGK
ncbi:hypothetical protein ASN18_1812 [Candidatus Magnetominusculus xianensis]|uniref:Uncharacterized protein n=2 Tax=Candidatus Magnetominusculus xianensis TaxID=1748249 RepID=A0ABR5SEP0_9BACT|nr:hypothetical protein ASN18_1812 [Candidatus Magnetominusculus xianensis]